MRLIQRLRLKRPDESVSPVGLHELTAETPGRSRIWRSFGPAPSEDLPEPSLVPSAVSSVMMTPDTVRMMGPPGRSHSSPRRVPCRRHRPSRCAGWRTSRRRGRSRSPAGVPRRTLGRYRMACNRHRTRGTQSRCRMSHRLRGRLASDDWSLLNGVRKMDVFRHLFAKPGLIPRPRIRSEGCL